MPSPKERGVRDLRESRRFSIKLPCSVLSEHGKSNAIILDLSVGGAFLGTRAPRKLRPDDFIGFSNSSRAMLPE
jgi:hypothetical protein